MPNHKLFTNLQFFFYLGIVLIVVAFAVFPVRMDLVNVLN